MWQTRVTILSRRAQRIVAESVPMAPSRASAPPSVGQMLAKVTTFAVEGVEGREVTVEVDVRRGLPAFSLVGLPDASVREARERVRAGLLNSELDFPLSSGSPRTSRPPRSAKAGPRSTWR